MLVTATPAPISLTQFTNTGHSVQDNSIDSSPELSAEGWVSDAQFAKSIYIHVPFCFHKCHYCDFYSIVGNESQYESFVDQLTKELAFVSPHLTDAETIFIGGGTPTLFDARLFQRMLESIQKYISRSASCEWTIEANPETVTQEKASILTDVGINRVSVGAQSFDPTLLKALERWHEPSSVQRAISYIRDAGILDYNLDLIYAIPKQTTAQLHADIEQAVALEPSHLSCYSLTYEPNTPLLKRLEQGKITRFDHDEEADMFTYVRKHLVSHGYAQYEISNFAKEGSACKHNIAYWQNKNWWAFGPSASGHVNGVRWKNTPRISEYLRFDSMPKVVDVERLLPEQSAGESFMLGLRLVQGMERSRVDSLVEQTNGQWRIHVLNTYIASGYLQWKHDYLSFTPKGQCFADSVILALLMQDESMTDTTEYKSL